MPKVKIVKPAQYRRGILQRGVLAYRDILDQPKAKYVVAVDPSPVQSMLFFADEVKPNGAYVILERTGADKPVAVFHKSIPWYAVAAEYIDILSTEEVARATAGDHAEMHRFEQDLKDVSGSCDPDADKKALENDELEKAIAKQYL